MSSIFNHNIIFFTVDETSGYILTCSQVSCFNFTLLIINQIVNLGLSLSGTSFAFNKVILLYREESWAFYHFA